MLDTLAYMWLLWIHSAGAGVDLGEAQAPAVLVLPGKARVLVFAFACPTSGVPFSWAAGPKAAGVSFLPDLSPANAARIGEHIERVRRPGDIIVVSLHWGPNWGHDIADQRDFAHALIDNGAVSLVHGHS